MTKWSRGTLSHHIFNHKNSNTSDGSVQFIFDTGIKANYSDFKHRASHTLHTCIIYCLSTHPANITPKGPLHWTIPKVKHGGGSVTLSVNIMGCFVYIFDIYMMYVCSVSETIYIYTNMPENEYHMTIFVHMHGYACPGINRKQNIYFAVGWLVAECSCVWRQL